MPLADIAVTVPIIRKLDSVMILTEAEREAVQSLPVRETEIKADQDIVREGDRPLRSCFVLDGVTCTYKLAAGGKRQIVNFHIPGDAPDLQSLHLSVLDISIGTITPCTIGFVQHEAVRDLCARAPRVAAAFWRQTLIDAAIYREWMTSIGQRSAYSRIAHLMCELVVRFQAIGQSSSYAIAFPITQNEIGDALGLSSVHVNRSIRVLKEDRLISMKDGTLEILDWEGLQHAGDFDPTYLHLKNEANAA